MQRGEDAEGQQHRAAAEVTHVVERRHRRLARTADGVQRAADRDVVDVVARCVGERAVLAPAGHAAVDQARVARMAFGGSEAQALHHAGAETFDEHVGFRDDVEHGCGRAVRAQVDLQRAAAAREDVVRRSARAGAFDADHLRAHVGEQHRAERPGADARHLDHPESLQ